MAKSPISGQNPYIGTDTHGQSQCGTGTDQSGTSTHPQKRVGTGTDISGTGTGVSDNPIFVPLHY